MACVAGHAEVVGRMLRSPAVDVNLPNRSGQTPLHVAAMNGIECVLDGLLRRKDIDVNRYGKK